MRLLPGNKRIKQTDIRFPKVIFHSVHLEFRALGHHGKNQNRQKRDAGAAVNSNDFNESHHTKERQVMTFLFNKQLLKSLTEVKCFTE